MGAYSAYADVLCKVLHLLCVNAVWHSPWTVAGCMLLHLATLEALVHGRVICHGLYACLQN